MYLYRERASRFGGGFGQRRDAPDSANSVLDDQLHSTTGECLYAGADVTLSIPTPLPAGNLLTYSVEGHVYSVQLSLSPTDAQLRLARSEAFLNRCWRGDPALALAVLDYRRRLERDLLVCQRRGSTIEYRFRRRPPQQLLWQSLEPGALVLAWWALLGYEFVELPGEGWLVYTTEGQQLHMNYRKAP